MQRPSSLEKAIQDLMTSRFKFCNGCNQNLEKSKFGLNRLAKDKLARQCRACLNKYQYDKKRRYCYSTK